MSSSPIAPASPLPTTNTPVVTTPPSPAAVFNGQGLRRRAYEKKRNTDAGRLLGRCRDTYGDTASEVQALITLDQVSNRLIEKPHNFEELEHRAQHITWLIGECPWLLDIISNSNAEQLASLCADLHKGRTEGRNDATKKLKSLVPTLNYNTVPGSTESVSLDPPVVAKDRSDRGFYHEQLALLVSDAEHPWNTLSDVERARLQTPGHNISVTTIRAYLYDGYQADRNNLTKGLYRSFLMQQVMIICHMRVDSIDKFVRKIAFGWSGAEAANGVINPFQVM
ncbi:hypothetical protein SISSUDRAFT_1061489 [Sistotremastrum suecicum HHB10207 ss-3]|uniref:Uncharacterized protein n=1 Tax=Sistotremastrum suecicum HHB10207 ss-3 TaxID=1314776 RepID=A0A166DX78_9AGAM|nr:hypothetical protein SISSUDRAFT_1061489 [Sistotremastrum suecicum HHB10207 ss-3]